ncbi:acetoacetate--CoA ligase [Aestuariispira insulae]|uniref:Acetoacetyl-CoA synthetase n=1 Tax=Aestuariispira insulae TaxID=1461337 RepID=A0A3D9HEY3_9PROT|nr:acetoacetate--CoA ligase [Aestuariispira insulae]RED48039.1 acetoacetyl-CoA synthetase [Aestuariispira insulae]
MTEPLWTPSSTRIAKANVTSFARALELQWGVSLPDYEALHKFSVDEMEKFWLTFWDFADIKAETRGERVLIDGDKMPGAQFFPDAKLNFAENLLTRRGDNEAITFWAEDKVKRRMTWRQLYDGVSRLAQAMRAMGVEKGDRIAGFVPNMPETVMAMLATTSIGAIWTSCSPDFGIQGVLDRFGQTKPKILFTADGYYYNGKSHDSLHRVREIVSDLPSVEKVVVLPLLDDHPVVSEIFGAETLADFTEDFEAGDIAFEQVEFNHPLYIMYSSGTTGAPKCIVHGTGGTLLNQKKEHMLHCDAKTDSRVFYFTTCGWMMWNWLVAALSCKASIMLYDGSPFAPDGNILFDYAAKERFTVFGTSAKYIDACNKAEIKPRFSHDLHSIQAILSTGSPLVDESFDYIYRDVKEDVQLASISGGTDILGCFIGGMPILPVYRGELQAAGLGMAINVFDHDGKPVAGEKGELVCTKPFPCMPVQFWNDPDNARYKAAYFEEFDNTWYHGDFVLKTENGGYVIYGRSDATLNPGGVRIGTAEIYRQVEGFAQVQEAIVIGQEWKGDVRVVLFVRLSDGTELDDNLVGAIRSHIRQQCTPRHVPAKVIAITDIPRTRSGKITELAVRDVVHGRPVKNKEALANPEALDLFKNIKELQED